MTDPLASIRSNAQLVEYVDRGGAPQYLFFWGHQPNADGSIGKSCFSQWFEAAFTIDGVRYLTAEHYMMAEKARLFRDDATCGQILAAKSPAEAKKLGRLIKNFNEEAWLASRFDVVVSGNVAKFAQNETLRAFLLSTRHRVLVEASPVDAIWGIGLASNDADATRPHRWRGLNLLGYALMEVRARLQGLANLESESLSLLRRQTAHDTVSREGGPEY
jgi:ribA/ribD-fused uncharacterized protein